MRLGEGLAAQPVGVATVADTPVTLHIGAFTRTMKTSQQTNEPAGKPTSQTAGKRRKQASKRAHASRQASKEASPHTSQRASGTTRAASEKARRQANKQAPGWVLGMWVVATGCVTCPLARLTSAKRAQHQVKSSTNQAAEHLST